MRIFAFLFSLFLLTVSPAIAQPAPSPVRVVLTPSVADGEIDRLGIELRFRDLPVAAGAALLRMPTLIVGTPTAAYGVNDIAAHDADGPLPLSVVDEESTPTGNYRRYVTARATRGSVTVRYAAPLREITRATRNGPLFDLRAQPGGAIGSGMYIFALPETEQEYRIDLSWNLAALPRGTRGVWSFGEGRQRHVGDLDMLQQTFYAVGAVRSEPANGRGDFGLFWFGEPPFDVEAVAAQVRPLYAYMSNFFRDPTGESYRVFVRQNLHPSGGGTALQRSFMFGYGIDGETTATGLQQLLAHEMAHNWPRLSDSAHALTAWYTEGNAEFYSLRLLYRAGLMSLDDFAEAMNERAFGYYTNPHIALSNAAAGELFWRDARAQRVPYGRGLMYLARVDAQVRAASGGVRSLDTLVLEVQERQRGGEQVGLAAWSEIIRRELGEAGVAEFEAMAAGQLIVPPEGSLGPCFRPVRYAARPFELGFDMMRLGVVADLLPNSAAANAGLREGDTIVSITRLNELQGDPDRMMEMVIERDGQRTPVTYAPRGAEVEAWRWERIADAPDAQCGL